MAVTVCCSRIRRTSRWLCHRDRAGQSCVPSDALLLAGLHVELRPAVRPSHSGRPRALRPRVPGSRRGGERADWRGLRTSRVSPGRRRAGAAGSERRGGVYSSGHPKRAVESRGHVHLGAGSAHERGGRKQSRDASAARDLQTHGVRNARGQRAVLGRGLVDRYARSDPGAHLAYARQPVYRLLDELQANGRERFDVAHRLLDVPCAVGVDTQRHVGTRNRAYRCHAARRRRRRPP